MPYGSTRGSAGTPDVGIFLMPGEHIADVTGSSKGWYVSTTGALAPAFASSTAVIKGELRSNASKIYYAQSAGTTGATAPTHSSGTASDGSVTWVYYSPQAAVTVI